MKRLNYYTDFRTLRQAYVEVQQFLQDETVDNEIQLNTKLVEDLGCSGDDNYELIEKFVSKYKLDITGFDYMKHFHSEAELYDSNAAFIRLIGLPIFIMAYLLKIISFKKIDMTQKNILPVTTRKTLDMTLGDMLAWRITGKYNLRKQMNVALTNVA